ncbi:NPCBM/NEW2 domain-containing protein [Streptomyces sp. NPDC001351]|uniref:NPCBM/NEW2 domain-containing protein n=1 Tax=unclassified Streptomyces TaxID=2593676 RepID=UPI0036B19FEA
MSETKPLSDRGIGSHSTSATINKESFPHSVAQYQSRCSESAEPDEWEYSVGSGFKWFSADVGLDDENSARDLSVEFEVYADGKPVFDKKMSAGPAYHMRVPVQDVLRIKLVATFTIAKNCSAFDQAVWGKAQFS